MSIECVSARLSHTGLRIDNHWKTDPKDYSTKAAPCSPSNNQRITNAGLVRESATTQERRIRPQILDAWFSTFRESL